MELNTLREEVKEMREVLREMREARVIPREQTSYPSPSQRQTRYSMDISDEEMGTPLPPRGEKGAKATVVEQVQSSESEVSGQEDLINQIARRILGQVGDLVNARLASLENRLLPEKKIRPPLAGPAQKRTQAPQRQVQQHSSGASTTYAAAAARRGGSPTAGPSTAGEKGKAGSRGRAVNAPKATVAGKTGPKAGSQQQRQQLKRDQAPLPAPSNSHEGWERVEGRKERKKKKEGAQGAKQKAPANTSTGAKGSAGKPAKNKKVRIRPPRSAAVILTLTAETVTRAEILAEARRKVRLEELGITYLRPKIAATGAIILEVPGENNASRADLLAEKLRSALAGREVNVTRPTKLAELRITGLDESITDSNLSAAVSGAGDCPADDVQVGEIRRNGVGLGAVWVKCPVVVARKLADAGRIMVGWVAARVEALPPRPLQCYKCLETGHTWARCTAPVDRGDQCYRCGRPGRTAGGCTAAPECPLCRDLGRPAGHRLGGAACKPPKKRGGAYAQVTGTVPSQAAPAADNTMQTEVETYPSLHLSIPTPATAAEDPKPQRSRQSRGGGGISDADMIERAPLDVEMAASTSAQATGSTPLEEAMMMDA